MVNDPIADFIIQLKNASAVKKPSVAVPYSQFLHAVAEVLIARGFLIAAAKKGKKARKLLEVELAYRPDGTPTISDVKRVSKPGRRLYSAAGALRPVRAGRGALVVSTPAGVFTGEEARKQNVGGELLFEIW